MKTCFGIIFVLISTSIPCGCVSYVNIPRQVGDFAIHDPNLRSVRQVEAKAIQTVLAEQPVETQVQIILPKGTKPACYDALVKQLGANTTWFDMGPQPGALVIQVRQVRIRGWRAEVDLIRPSHFQMPPGPHQLTTVSLKWDPGAGWQSQHVQLWSIGVREALFDSRRQAARGIAKQ